MEIRDIYLNALLISIANGHNFYQLVRETEEETEKYVADHKQHSFSIYDTLPEGVSGLYFMETLARKAGSSLGEVYFLTQYRKEEIIQLILKSIDPIEEAFSDYYDDSIEGQIEFQGVARILDASNLNRLRQHFRTEEADNMMENNSFGVPYTVTFQRFLEGTEKEATIEYTLYISAIDSFSSQYICDDYILWTGRSGPIVDYINKVIDAYKEAESKKSVAVDINVATEIYSIIPYKNSISEDLRQLTEKVYIQIGGNNAASRFLPVFINRETHLLYIPVQLFSDYREELIKGSVTLCDSFSDNGQVISVVSLQERVTDSKEESIKPQNDKFSIVICKDASNSSTGKEKRLVMIKTQDNTKIFSPVYVDWNEHLIYFNEHSIIDNYKSFDWNELELFSSYNSRDRKVKINPLPRETKEALVKKAKEREMLVANESLTLQKASQNLKKNAKAKAKSNKEKKPRCPNCHKPYEGDLIEDSFNAPGKKMCYKCYREFRIAMRN